MGPIAHALQHSVVESMTTTRRYVRANFCRVIADIRLRCDAACQCPVARPALEQVHDDVRAEASHVTFRVLL